MRVLLVSQEMPPETGWGGIGTYTDVLSRALALKGHEVHVLSVVHGQPASRAHRNGVAVHRHTVPAIPDPTGCLPEAWRRLLVSASVAMCARRLEFQPDVVECPEWMAEGLMLGFSEAIPLVVRLHSSARQIFPFMDQGRGCRGLDGKLAARLEDMSVRRAHLVTSTQANFDEVSERLGLNPQATRVVPVPVELPPLSPPDPNARPRVTFVGRLEPRKAPEVILRIARAVLDAVPDVEFVFVGRDVMPPGTIPSADWIREEARRLGLGDAIRLTGELSRDGVNAELRQATVCVFPSRWESFGIAVAEASGVGRPVIATPIAPFRDLVVDGVTGRLLPAEDVDGWANSLINLLHDRKQARYMGEAGASHVAAITDPSHVADLALAAYEEARGRWVRRQRAGRSEDEAPPRVRHDLWDSTASLAGAHTEPELGRNSTQAQPAVETSVIMCVHNGAATMEDQLAALAAQNHNGSWELLVVNNGSTDETANIARAWSGRIPTLRVIEANDQLGLAYARNVGATAATGRFLAFCDADDVADPAWVSALAKGLRDADLVGGALELERLNSGLAQYWRGMFIERLDWPYLGYLPYAVGANFAVRKEAFEAVNGCDERFTSCGDDVDFSWRIQRAGGRLVFSPDPVMHYRLREDLRGVLNQRYRYGVVEALLRRKFEDSVQPMDSGVRLRSLARHLMRSWHVLAGRYRRGGWLAHAANLVGQLRGSLRYRVVA